MTEIAFATDFMGGNGSPEKPLRLLADVGVTHLHWCHQWSSDFLYAGCEIAQIRTWLRDFGLKLLDIHGSDGVEKKWYSTVEYERQAGVELVANRMRMLRALDGTGALMMHIPVIQKNDKPPVTTPEELPQIHRQVESLRRSLDELMPLSQELQVPIAIENMANDTFEIIEALLADYPPEFLGLCYDSGHGNIGLGIGPDHLERNLDRLMALHLHDNDGAGDQHLPPFYGNVNWKRIAGDIRKSPYPRPFSFELSTWNTPFREEPKSFLADAFTRCMKVVTEC